VITLKKKAFLAGYSVEFSISAYFLLSKLIKQKSNKDFLNDMKRGDNKEVIYLGFGSVILLVRE